MVRMLSLLAALLIGVPAHADLKVFATVPEWAALAREIGGARVTVFAATQALQDPHRVEARPSLIAQARNADVVLATGAELEIGWLPLVLRESANPRIQPGQSGYFEATRFVRLLEAPARIDRAEGDIHGQGNPHIQTDPRNMLKVAEALAQRFAELDAANAAAYRAGQQAFVARWQAALSRWQTQGAALKGLPVVVQHKSFSYLVDWLGLKEVATLEPKPGVEASAGHLARVAAQAAAQGPRLVVRAAYESARPAEGFAGIARVPVAVLPFTVGGSERARDLEGLFDDTLARLTETAK